MFMSYAEFRTLVLDIERLRKAGLTFRQINRDLGMFIPETMHGKRSAKRIRNLRAARRILREERLIK